MDIVRKTQRGRPRAIPSELEPMVVELHKEGYGYRLIAKTLRTEHSVNADYSTIRRLLIRLRY